MTKTKKILIGVSVAAVAVSGATIGAAVAITQNKANVAQTSTTKPTGNHGFNTGVNNNFPNYNNGNQWNGNNIIEEEYNEHINNNKPLAPIIPSTPGINKDIYELNSHLPADRKPIRNQVSKSNFSLKRNTTRSTFNKMYVLEVTQNLKEGKIYFEGDDGIKHADSIAVNPGDKITVTVEFNDDYANYGVEKLYVFSADRNYRLNVEQNETTKEMSFLLPPSKVTDKEEKEIDNPFYNGNTKINVEPVFNVKNWGDWQLGKPNEGYKFTLTDEYMQTHKDTDLAEKGRTGLFVSNFKNYTQRERQTSPNLDLNFLGEYETDKEGLPLLNEYGDKIVKENTKFTLDLNGYDLYVSDWMIPSGVQLEITNSKVNQFNGKGKEVKVFGLQSRVTKHAFDLHGSLGIWHGIKLMKNGTWTINDEKQYKEFQEYHLFDAYAGDGQMHGTHANKDHQHHNKPVTERIDGKIAMGLHIER